MEFIDPATFNEINAIWAQLRLHITALVYPSRIWQVAALIVAFGLAHVIGRWIVAPRLSGWARSRALNAQQLRWVIVIRDRMRGIVFVTLAWMLVVVAAQLTPFVSYRFIVELVATICTAWLAIGIFARLIPNPLIRKLVTWALWIGVTLHYLGLGDDAANILDGIALTFGSFRLSALTVVKALIITTVLLAGARLFSRQASGAIRRNEEISPSMRELIIKGMQVMLFGMAAYIGLKSLGFDLTGLAVLSGAIGVGLGFGLQKVVSNLISGVIILLDKSIKPGDVISLGETFGWIHSLGARYVSVVTRDGKEFLIPNEDLITGQVVNWSHSDEFVRIDLFFGTSYNDDPHLVRKVALEAAQSVDRVLKDRRTVCHIVGFGDSSVDYILRFWITDPVEGLTNVRGAVYLALWDKFKEHDISIPFPQREVTVLRGSTLSTQPVRENTAHKS